MWLTNAPLLCSESTPALIAASHPWGTWQAIPVRDARGPGLRDAGSSYGRIWPGQNLLELHLRLRWLAPYLPSLFPELSCYPWLSPRFFLHRTWPSPQYMSYISIFLGVCILKDSNSCSYCYQLGLYYLDYIRKPKITLSAWSSNFISLMSRGAKSSTV